MRRFILILFVLLLVGLVSAQDYSIKEVYINGINVDSGDEVAVDVGSVTRVQVVIEGYGEGDVRVKGWIGSYDEYYSEMFDVEEGITYSEVLYLRIPEEIDGGEYTLHVEVFDHLNRITKEYTLYVEEDDEHHRHAHIRSRGDVIVSFESIKNVYVNEEEQFKVMVTNLGKNSEEFCLKVNGREVDEAVVGPGASGDLFYTISVSEEGENEVLVSVYDDEGVVKEKSVSFNAIERESVWAIGAGVLIGMLAVGGIIFYLRSLK
jgi:hypothetical protein